MNRILQLKPISLIRDHKIIASIGAVILLIAIFLLRPKAPPKVETVTVTRGNITQSVSSTGSIDSSNVINLSFQIGGKLVYLSAKKGDEVKRGQTIASLDQIQAQNTLETKLKDYSEQRNTFDQTIEDNGGRTPNEALNDKMKRILENNQYDLDKAVLSVEMQDLIRQESVLTTPISGVVIREDTSNTGVNITPTSVFTVADPSNLVFKMDVDESDIGHVRTGQEMDVNLDAFPDKTFHLTVTHIDFASHTTSTGATAYTVQANFPSSAAFAYRLGMNGDAEIVTDQKKDVIKIPLAAIIQNHYVYVRTPGGFVKRSITTGIASDVEAEVTGGLKAGDQVALQPTEAAKQEVKSTSGIRVRMP